jgi:ribonuclease HI
MILIAIDGACRRNGKSDCISAGGLFIKQYTEDLTILRTQIKFEHEYNSTNQRGELLALLLALDCAWQCKEETQIVTDSEYLFNTMTKNWYTNWQNNGWKSVAGSDIKNKDYWMQIIHMHDTCVKNNIEILFYHIQGHAMPFGKVTASTLLNKDRSGLLLYNELCNKFENNQKNDFVDLNELSIKNNGFKLEDVVLKEFVVSNIVADSVATLGVELADGCLPA